MNLFTFICVFRANLAKLQLNSRLVSTLKGKLYDSTQITTKTITTTTQTLRILRYE